MFFHLSWALTSTPNSIRHLTTSIHPRRLVVVISGVNQRRIFLQELPDCRCVVLVRVVAQDQRRSAHARLLLLFVVCWCWPSACFAADVSELISTGKVMRLSELVIRKDYSSRFRWGCSSLRAWGFIVWVSIGYFGDDEVDWMLESETSGVNHVKAGLYVCINESWNCRLLIFDCWCWEDDTKTLL